MQRVIRKLAALFMGLGSVNAVAEKLSSSQIPADGAAIYPNRVHGLLAADPARSVNTATLENLEVALASVEKTAYDASVDADLTRKIRHSFAAEEAKARNRQTALERTAAELSIPLGVVQFVAGEPAGAEYGAVAQTSRQSPDWSWQDDAVGNCLEAIRQSPAHKAGLIVPTAGGKTRIALRIILEWLAAAQEGKVVLWVTHRARLKQQARRTLQRLLSNPEILPEGASSIFAKRIDFVMITDLRAAIERHGEGIGLIVIDEAHHAAAASYQPIFDVVAPGVFLTATPNRLDALAIGIDSIAYTITYRELLNRGCVVEPVFEQRVDMGDLDWSEAEGLRNLADYILDRAEQDFAKVLVAVSMRSKAEVLHEALTRALEDMPEHPLSEDDVAFVHGGASSGPGDSMDFLDEFTARPRGVLVATSQLIGEGFDDPLIDSVVITFPSNSISHLMQVGGRALRWAEGKDRAHIVQVHESPMEYHFSQRWLYQDISDVLRPDLLDRSYATRQELRVAIEDLLKRHNVSTLVHQRILAELENVGPAEDVQLMLTGIPYSDSAEQFDELGQWGCILVSSGERRRFVQIFNDVSFRDEDIKEHGHYLNPFISRDTTPGSLRRSYVDLITAMEYARREIRSIPYANQRCRGYEPGHETTWLRYVSFSFEPAIPHELDGFLADSVNREPIITQYLSDPSSFETAVKLDLPLAGSLAFLLDAGQTTWLEAERAQLIQSLREADSARGFQKISEWAAGLAQSPLPIMVVEHIAQLIRAEDIRSRRLTLKGRLPSDVDEAA